MFKNTVRRYIPDFYVNNEYVEIKGAHFFFKMD